MNLRAASTLSLLAGLACIAAGGAWAKSSDRDQPMNVTANSSDCSVDESKPCILSGSVHITQGTLDIQSAKADVRRGGNQQLIKLTGSPVKMKQQMDDGGWMNATASQIDYDQNRDTVVFSGKAVVQQPGRARIAGERIIYNMATGQVQSGTAAGGGRVNMTFEPKNKSAGNRPAPDKAEPAPEPSGQDDD